MPLDTPADARDVVHARAVEAGGEKHRARAVHDLAPLGSAVVAVAGLLVQSLHVHALNRVCPVII